MSLFPDPELFGPPGGDDVHLLAELDQVNERPVITTACGLTGAPRMPSEPQGIRTGWTTFATCPTCLETRS